MENVFRKQVWTYKQKFMVIENILNNSKDIHDFFVLPTYMGFLML